MAALEVPDEERAADSVVADLNKVAAIHAEKLKAKKEAELKAKRDAELKAKKEAEAKALAEKKRLAANPSRIWVQIATGRDTSALAFDFRRMRKKYAVEIGKKDASTAEWGSTRRLLIGPYSSRDKAKAAAADLKKAGSDAFLWISEAGEVVTPLGDK